MNKNLYLSTIKTLISSFSAVSDETILERVPTEALKNLEAALVNVGITMVTKRKAKTEIVEVRPTKESVKTTVVAIPSKQQQTSFVEALELRVTTVGNELHVMTPYWAPLNIKLKKRLPKGVQRWDTQNDVRIVPIEYREVVLETMQEAFCKSRRPVYCVVDGQRLQFSAGS